MDIKTGQPLADARVYYSYTEQVDGKPVYRDEDIKTDSTGEFICTFFDLNTFPQINRDGYLGKDLGKDIGFSDQYPYKYKLKIGTTLDIGDQGLYKNDGVFKIILRNKAGLYDSVYGVLKSKIMQTETITSLFLSSNAISNIAEGQDSSLIYNIPADDWVKIYWGDQYFTSYQFAPHLDSFYVNSIDTAVYILSY